MGLQVVATTRRWSLGKLLSVACIFAILTANCRADDSESKDLHFSMGPGIYSVPHYPGAQGTRRRFFPFIDAEYGNRFYTSASDLFGIYAIKSDSTQAGAAIMLDPMRRETFHEARLRHLRSIPETTRLKLFASRTLLFVTADGSIATDVLGRGQGTLAQANLWFTAPLTSGFSINAGPGVTWADSRYMQSFFSVTPAEADASPLLAPYGTRAGILDTHLNGLAEWQFLSHYRIGAQIYVARLDGIAAGSPIVKQRTQRSVVGWVAYRFR